MADSDDDLAEAVHELTRTIDALRQELESSHRRSGRRLPAPRPPTPEEFFRFADEIAVPATIAVLETSVRALEGFQRALKLARTEREVREQTTETASAVSKRATDLRQSTLSRLDTVLSQLQQATADGTLPADDRATDLLSEARELRDDVDSRLRDVDSDLEGETAASPDGDSDSGAVRIDIQDGGLDDSQRGDDGDGRGADRTDPNPAVDVDAELETLKDQYSDDKEDDGSSNERDGLETDAGSGEFEGDDADGDGEETAESVDTADADDADGSDGASGADDSDDPTDQKNGSDSG
ncbi:hypothetical protein GS429_19865 [Natronorubrum sp. JWXQ-INN-674]|uniref:Uncharacterized protein n=1 Tax=Natronorubrum halalkaliphilum TaxID=2691917 RepID=A0A6B0VR43_9EURY|nr:hypothetical protein [Natronorubrum halalkaliphilum]MXV64281.1 hypothetical protein [Natronorubrum halalkaliphilum]